MRSFAKIKFSRNAEITLLFTDIGKSCPSGEFLVSQICLLTLFAKIKFSQKFPDLQYEQCTTFQGGAAFVDPFVICVSFFSLSCCLVIICSLVVTCSMRAGSFSLFCVVFTCYFFPFPYSVLGQVWCLIVLIPDLCLLPYFIMFVKHPLSPYEDTEGLDEPAHLQRTNHDLPSTSL